MTAEITRKQLLVALKLQGWEYHKQSLYDEEGVEGWTWTGPDDEYTVVGDWGELPPIPDELEELVSFESERHAALWFWLRSQGQEYGPSQIEPASHDDCVFEVNPHTVKDGTSPKEAQRLINQLREALQVAVDATTAAGGRLVVCKGQIGGVPVVEPVNKDVCTWTTETFKQGQAWPKNTGAPMPVNDCRVTYRALEQLMRAACPEYLKLGCHEVLNTLFFLADATEDTHAIDHRATLREALNGEPIKDRRKTRRTNDAEYMVLDEDEANQRWDESLENYLDECIEGADGPYFDREAWKRDAKVDGRGHSLSGYDGEEHYHDGFYIYRIN